VSSRGRNTRSPVTTSQGRTLTRTQAGRHRLYPQIQPLHRLLGLAAAQALREINAGHEDTVAAILSAAGLDGLSNEEPEMPCDRFGVEA
jgi:hypothetical protein